MQDLYFQRLVHDWAGSVTTLREAIAAVVMARRIMARYDGYPLHTGGRAEAAERAQRLLDRARPYLDEAGIPEHSLSHLSMDDVRDRAPGRFRVVVPQPPSDPPPLPRPAEIAPEVRS